MEYSIEDILKDLINIDSIATEVNEKRQKELDEIRKQYKEEMKKLDRQLEEEKNKAQKYIDNAMKEAQKEAKAIEKEKMAYIEKMDEKYDLIKDEILKVIVDKIFGTEMDNKWMP